MREVRETAVAMGTATPVTVAVAMDTWWEGNVEQEHLPVWTRIFGKNSSGKFSIQIFLSNSVSRGFLLSSGVARF